MGAVILSGTGEMSGQATRPCTAGQVRLWPWALTVLALAALLFFLRLGERALWAPEGRWAEIVREMQLSGNYFWPTINGKVYYDKPLLSYWLVVAASHLTGGINETAARLPSAVAGLLGIALLIILAQRLYGRRTAILAGFILATSHSYVFFSRLASADMETVAGVLAALTLFVVNEKQQGGWWIAGLWLIMALTSLTKGLLGFALPLLVVGSYSLLAEGWRRFLDGILRGPLEKRLIWLVTHARWCFNWKTLVGVGVAGLVYFLPFAISYALMHSSTGIYMAFRENVIRFVDPFDHRGPVYLYAYGIFVLMVPWSAFLPAALFQMHSKPQDKSDRFTLAYFWATFLFFTLSGSRRNYYLLPILPAAAILVAHLFATPREALDSRARKLMGLGYILTALLVVAVGVLALLPPAMRPGTLSGLPALPDRMVFAAFWGLELAVLVYAFFELWPERMVLSISAVAYLSLLYLFVFAFPGAELYRGEKAFAQAVRAELKGDMRRLVLYRIWGPGLLFYLSAEDPILQYDEGAALARLIENNPDFWVIAPERDLASLPLRGSVVAREETLRWNRSKHQGGDLVLFRPQPRAK